MTKMHRHHVLGSARFNADTGELRDGSGNVVPLRPQTAQVLAFLLSRRGRLVSKRELMKEIWKDVHVTDDSLVQCVSEIRKALGPDGGNLLRTVPKEGYRIIPQPDRAHDEGGVRGIRADGGVRRLAGARRTVFVSAAVLMASLAVFLLWERSGTQPDRDAPARVASVVLALLPIEGIGVSEEHRHVADGLTDDLTTTLAQNEHLTVISRDSTFRYRQSELSDDDIFARLGVTHLVKGSLQSEGESLRVNIRMNHAGNGAIVWARTFEGSLRGLFKLEARIVAAIEAELEGRNGRGEASRDMVVRTPSQQAYRSFQLGRQLFFEFRDRRSNRQARALFEEAVAHDPDFAMAHAMLAMTYSVEAQNGWSTDRVATLDRAEEAAQAATSKNAEIPLSYFVTGLVHRERGEYVKAMVEAEKAIELDPSYANAHVLLATLLYYAGRPAESIARLKEAMCLNPHHPFQYNFHLGQAYFTEKRYDDAIETLLDGLESNPASERLHVWLAASYARAGLLEDAEWEAEQVLAINPEFSVAAVSEAYPFESDDDRRNLADALGEAGLK